MSKALELNRIRRDKRIEERIRKLREAKHNVLLNLTKRSSPYKTLVIQRSIWSIMHQLTVWNEVWQVVNTVEELEDLARQYSLDAVYIDHHDEKEYFITLGRVTNLIRHLPERRATFSVGEMPKS